MRLGELPPGELTRRLQGGELQLQTGPFVFRLQSPHCEVAAGVAAMYERHRLADDAAAADFALQIAPGRGVHRFWHRQARFVFDGRPVFEPLPASHAFALLEWSMNWCISSHAHQYLIVHAAVLARGEQALLLPAPPGSGKSTLCAALMLSGWRLLSDELTLLRMDDGSIDPLVRPVSLKNRSIDVIGQRFPQACFSAITRNTTKGDVAHLQPPGGAVDAVAQRARARWIVYPRYVPDSATVATPRGRAAAVIDMARNAFNFALQGTEGFERLVDVVAECDCHDFVYSSLDEALAHFDALAAAG